MKIYIERIIRNKNITIKEQNVSHIRWWDGLEVGNVSSTTENGKKVEIKYSTTFLCIPSLYPPTHNLFLTSMIALAMISPGLFIHGGSMA